MGVQGTTLGESRFCVHDVGMTRFRRTLIPLLLSSALLSAQDKPGITAKDGDIAKTGVLPSATQVLASQAATAFSKRDWNTARKAYREMLDLDPQNALAWANLGAVEQQARNLDKAVEAFENSVRYNPQLIQSWIAAGLIYSTRGDRYKAVSLFTRAIHEDPLDARAHNYLAIEAQALGWHDTAISELQRAIEIKGDYGLAHFNLAAMYLDQTPPSKVLAKKHYDEALKLGVEKDEVMERKLAAD